MDASCSEMVEYGYSILTYARKYDKEWIQAIEHLKVLVGQKPVAQVVVVNCFPDESVYQVMGYLDHSDLLLVSTVSKGWNRLSNRNELWNHLLFTKFSVSPATIKIRQRGTKCHPVSSKEIFKEMLATLQFVLSRLHGQNTKMDRQPLIPSSMYQHLVSVH